MVHANCEKFLSVVGGNALFSSYFGGQNVIYGKQTSLEPAIRGYWKDFANTEILYTQNEEELVSLCSTQTCRQLAIKKMKYKDVKFFNEVRNECCEWLHDPTKYSLEESQEWFKREKRDYYVLQAENENVGYFRTSLRDDENKTMFVGLDIHEHSRGLKLAEPAYYEFFQFIKKKFATRVVFLRVLKKNVRAKHLYGS